MKLLLAFAALLAAAQAPNAHAQAAYPGKPIRFIVPYAPGGLGDTFSRDVSSHLQEKLGQPIVIDNRPGAAQAIGLEAAAKAVPDGHTLVLSTMSGLVFLTASRKTLPYDPVKDFASITLFFGSQFYLVVNPALPAASLKELLANAKANPGKLSYASIGIGSGHHLAMEVLSTMAGIDMLHVPYKTSSQAMLGLIAGEVQLMLEGPVTTIPQIKNGKIRVLGSSAAKRSPAMPDVPTIGEAGVPGYDFTTWYGLSTQAAVPRPIVERLNREVVEWLNMPATRKKYQASNLDLAPTSPEEMQARIQKEIPVFTKVMRAAGIEPE